jgi:hypothetical protein
VVGHGGHDSGTSMDDMTRDMGNRFLVAALLSIPIVLWSPRMLASGPRTPTGTAATTEPAAAPAHGR